MGPPASHAFHQRVWSVALVVHVIAAWFSSGFYAADEHYQVIAFAQAKLGDLSTADLPWEYEAGIRSALLPGIAYVIIGASRSFITTNPFHIAFLLRLITAMVSLVVVRSFVRAALSQVSDRLHQPFILLSYFLWFLPYQHVRFATETWSGLLFLLGLAQMLGKRGNGWSMLGAGLCFGFSLQLKPVMCIACLGSIAWALFADKERRASLLHLLAGLAAALALGVLVDYWFYEAYTPTLWNYMRLAVIGDPAHTFETYPWYYYFPWMLKYGIWPIGILLICALAWITFRQPRALVVWCIWPYLIVLSIIPHKELRFLFPLVDLAPLAIVLAWQEWRARFPALLEGMKQKVLLSCIALVAMVNAAGLVVASTTAAGSGRTRLAETMGHIHPSDPMTLGYALNEPGIWNVRIPEFYLSGDLVDVGFFDPCWKPSVLSGPEWTTLLIAPLNDRSGQACMPGSGGYRRFARSESAWASELLDLYNSERYGPYVLYRIEPAPSHPSEP
jgi:phosphatidylinositol glycan class B